MGTRLSVLGLASFGSCSAWAKAAAFRVRAKAVAEWFPPKERALAFGIFNTGSSVGAVIAPPLIALIVSTLGWRWVFFITGGVGFCGRGSG